MKKLTNLEYYDRIEAIARARKIFIPHLTRNISIAFELYQEVLAEQERDRFLTTITGGKAPRTWLDLFERPECPLCKEPLFLRLVTEPKGRKNRRGWKSCWECQGPTCAYESYSKKDLKGWLKRLRRKRNA